MSERAALSPMFGQHGIALPGAVAAALHSPERRIVAAMATADCLMNSQEFGRPPTLNVDFTVVIFNE